MSSKLTEITESSPSVPPASVLCGFDIFSQLGSPWLLASSGHFDPSQIYDGYKAVNPINTACTECLKNGQQCFQNYNPRSSKCHHCFVGKKPCQFPGIPLSNVRQYLWSKKEWKFGRESPVSEALTSDGTSGHSNCKQRDVARWTNVGGPIPSGGSPTYSSSEFPISRIKIQGVGKKISRISGSHTHSDDEGSDKLAGEEVEVVNSSIDHHSSTSPSQPSSKGFQSQVIPSTPRNFHPILSTIPSSIPPPSPNASTARPCLASPKRPLPIPQPKKSPIVT
ncbi:hypothetical protein O181_012388 [Austropuccinia psidii MF-1]|uniref:Uncharacterized protein n=1 Tax=Austropuccinia psidii MF-1 TaxID=1389203 RepID=A0A9Q3GM65_9BASI|nr:hypothetical protein [Austropuccinia psidii MF-1]